MLPYPHRLLHPWLPWHGGAPEAESELGASLSSLCGRCFKQQFKISYGQKMFHLDQYWQQTRSDFCICARNPATSKNSIYSSHCTDETCSKTTEHLSEAHTWERQNTRLSRLVREDKWGRNKETIIPVWQTPLFSRQPFNPLSCLEKVAGSTGRIS